MTNDAPLIQRARLAARGLDRPDRDPSSPFVRARRGVYGATSLDDRDSTGRYRRIVLAANLTLTGQRVFSHESAAVLLGLPLLGPWPDVVHLICDRRSGGRSQLDVVRHCIGLEAVDPVLVHGVAVTSPARTAFDLALARPFPSAVVVADAVLRLHPEAGREFAGLVEWYGRGRGFRRLARVSEFADGRSGSPGESYSRVLMDELGFARPVLQFEVATDGRSEFGDFAWPESGTLGEFDGEAKYRDDRYRLGGSAEDVVIREKNRENRMRRVLPRVARWGWRDLRAGRLERILISAGVPKRDAR